MKQKPIISVLSFILCLVLLTATLTACHQVSYPETYWIKFPDNIHPNSIEVMLDVIMEDYVGREPEYRYFNFTNIDYVILPQVSEEYEIKSIYSEPLYQNPLYYVLKQKNACEDESCSCCLRTLILTISLSPAQKYQVNEFEKTLTELPLFESSENGKKEWKELHTAGNIRYQFEKVMNGERASWQRLITYYEGFQIIIEAHHLNEKGKELSEEALEDLLHAVKSFYAMPVTEVKEKGRKALEGTPLYDPVRATITTTTTTTMATPTYTTESTKKSPSTAEPTLNLPTVIVGF